MYIKNIKLINFKKHIFFESQFTQKVNCIVGKNGAGKTNILDAIYYLSIGKSLLSLTEAQNINHENDFFRIEGNFEKIEKNYFVEAVFKRGSKKNLKVNFDEYEKMSQHLGLLPLVSITPDDIYIIKDGSEERRKFFDSILSQFDKNYLTSLVNYQHFLKQRNATLKYFAESGTFNIELIETYDEKCISLSQFIFKARKEFVESYSINFENQYSYISGEIEKPSVKYISNVDCDDFAVAFKNNLRRDIALQRTTMGIHTDDYVFELNQFPLKKYGSQGQQKSFLLALKLLKFEILQINLNIKPILLLDDIFDKLDDFRIQKLIFKIKNEDFGQVFITDARPERTDQILKSNNLDFQIINLD